MKQRHSFTELWYHVVFRTKRRAPYIQTPKDIIFLRERIRVKARAFDAMILEFDGWLDHVHLLARVRPTIALAKFYGQVKGFASHCWKKERGTSFAWADGVFAETVDPHNAAGLRRYIKEQAQHHSQNNIVRIWEPEEQTNLPLGHRRRLS